MGISATARRRWIGALALFGAVLMLLVGGSVKDRLSPVGFLVYWLVCVLLTCAAVFTAFVDLRVNRERLSREQKELLHSTMEKIEIDARLKAKGNKPGFKANGKK